MQQNEAIKVEPIVPVETRQERRDAWILIKVRENYYSVQKATRENSEFADAVKKWKSGEIKREDFLVLARKYVPVLESVGSKPLIPKHLR